MNAARVRRGSSATRPRAAAARPRSKPRSRRAASESGANKLAAWAFGAFLVATGAVAAYALDLPAKAGIAAGEAVGDAGFRVRSVEVEGTRRMDPKPIYAIALGEKAAALPLVDVEEIRRKLLGFGWVKDARVMRRYPDSLVIDIVERQPSALWQRGNELSLIDDEGVVLDRVPVSRMPDLPLLVGPGANAHAIELNRLMARVPTIRAQLASASWIGQRRWDLTVATGETIALPEGVKEAAAALDKFARADKATPLLGKGYVRFDLRIPGKMTVRLPRVPEAADTPVNES